MTRDELKIRTQQAIDAVPVLMKKDYGWSAIESMLYEILIELDEPDWLEGEPFEEGDYLLIIKAPKGVPHYFPNHLNSEGKWRYVYRGNIIAYQRLIPCEDIVNLI